MTRLYLVIATFLSLKVLCIVQFKYLNGFDDTFKSGLVLNLITEVISILITILIVDVLIKRQEKKEQEKEEALRKREHEKLIKEVLGNKLKDLFKELSSIYINFVTKKPLKLSKEEFESKSFVGHKNAIIEILDNLDDYIDSDFRSKPVRTLLALGGLSEGTYSYQIFCRRFFKAKIEHVIGKFIERYISILPDDLRISLYKIENAIDDFVFITLEDIGLEDRPMPTSEQDITNLKEQLLIIGSELLYIHKLIFDE